MTSQHVRAAFGLLLFGVICAVATGCGSTKVYDTRKTIVYGDQMYNVTDTKQFSATEEGSLPDGTTVDLKNADKKKLQELLKQYKNIPVRMAFHFDDKVLLYRQVTATSWSDFDRAQSDFQRAGKKIREMMEDERSTQLKLK